MITDRDIKQTLARCSGYDPAHFPKPSEVVALAWMDHLQQFPSIQPEDLVKAVREYYNQPARPVPQPADISRIARKYVRERIERSDLDSAERLALEAKGDAKAAPEPPALTAAAPVDVGVGKRLARAGWKGRQALRGPQTLGKLMATATLGHDPHPEDQPSKSQVEAQLAREAAPPTIPPCDDCGETAVPCPCEAKEEK